MTNAVDITAVLTAHSEGVLAGPSLVSFEQAIEAAQHRGLSVESVIVLDRPDAATRLQFQAVKSWHRVIVTDEGDPGQARNAAVTVANGNYVAFLDGDDLWSQNWLFSAHPFCVSEPDTMVAHSEVNVIFGAARQMWWHVDSRDPTVDLGYLRVGNYWDAMSFASRTIFERYPFVANNLQQGFGHEDWHWNCVTLAAGIDHRPVSGTVHFKRRRAGSQMSLCHTVNAVPWTTPVTFFDWPTDFKVVR